MRFSEQRSKIITLSGGIDESTPSLLMSPGTLIECTNYIISEGNGGGYTSVKGYERFDGIGGPSDELTMVMEIRETDGTSTTPLVKIILGDTISGVVGVAVAIGDGIIDENNVQTVEVSVTTPGFVQREIINVLTSPVGYSFGIKSLGPSEDHHVLYDTNRAIVSPVGTALAPCEGPVLGLAMFKNSVYAFRKKTGLGEIGLYVEDSVDGWIEVDTSANVLLYITGGHSFEFYQYNFYATVDTNAIYWVDGVNDCRSFDGVTVTTIINANTGTIKPSLLIARSNRLFLGYPGGSLQFSILGDPTDYTAASGAGQVDYGSEITNLIIGVGGALIITTETGIEIIEGETPTTWVSKHFSDESGARFGSAIRMLGTILLMDDRGLTTLEAVSDYGDFDASTISKRFKKTLLSKKQLNFVTTSSRDLNQYKQFFSDGSGIITTFSGKKVKGTTLVSYPIPVSVVASGINKNKEDITIFSSDVELLGTEDISGYVYRMDHGTSFDNLNIITKVVTAFHSYNNPRVWKRFISVMIEAQVPDGLLLDFKVNYDYGGPSLPPTEWIQWDSGQLTSSTSEYGVAVYGEDIYGETLVATNVPLYLLGWGSSASFKILTNKRYSNQHTLQNIIVDYNLNGRKV